MSDHTSELIRYIVNGIVATAVHFGILTLNINEFNFSSAGLANFVAAIFGITASYLGSRYFVFQKTNESILTQAMKFGGLYGTIAILHGVVLLVWSDWLGLDYRVGFLVATIIQVSLSYVGNKLLVFKT